MSSTNFKKHNTMKTLRKQWVIILFIFRLVSVLHAQEKQDTTQLQEVIITATRDVQIASNVTQLIDVLHAKQLSRIEMQKRNLMELLMYRSGASVSVLSRNDANWGTFGGIGPKYSTLMLDGLPLDVFVDPMNLDLEYIERVEYQKGPASILYSNYLSQDFAGNQAPLAGTINVILKDRFEKPHTSLLTSYGSYDTKTMSVFHGSQINEQWSFMGGMFYENSDYTDYGTDGSWLNMKKNPQYTKVKYFGGATWRDFTGRQWAKVFMHQTRHNGDAGRVYRGYAHQYSLAQLQYGHKLNDILLLSSSVGMRHYDRSWQESVFTTFDSLLSNNGVFQRIIPLNTTFHVKHLKNSTFAIGVDAQSAEYLTFSDPLQGYRSYGNFSRGEQYGAYAQEDFRWKNLVIRAGARFQHVQQHISLLGGVVPPETKAKWNVLLYSGGVKYRLSEQLHFYANAGTSFMSPGLKSIGGTIAADDTISSGQLPNPDLKPEYGLGIDAGVWMHIWKIRANVRGFYMQVRDAIVENVVRQTPSQTMSVNAGTTMSQGAEMDLHFHLQDWMQFFANATLMRTSIENPFDEDQDGSSIPFSPELMANAGFNLEWNKRVVFVPYIHYNGGYYDSSSKTNRRFFKPGVIFNTSIQYQVWNGEQAGMSVFVNFYNLTNNRYEMPWQFRDTGFAWTVGLRATL